MEIFEPSHSTTMVLMDWCSYIFLGLDSSTPLSCNSGKLHVLLNMDLDLDLSLKLGVSFVTWLIYYVLVLGPYFFYMRITWLL